MKQIITTEEAQQKVSLKEIQVNPKDHLRGKDVLAITPEGEPYLLTKMPGYGNAWTDVKWFWACLIDHGNRWREPDFLHRTLENYPDNASLYIVDSLEEMVQLLWDVACKRL